MDRCTDMGNISGAIEDIGMKATISTTWGRESAGTITTNSSLIWDIGPKEDLKAILPSHTLKNKEKITWSKVVMLLEFKNTLLQKFKRKSLSKR